MKYTMFISFCKRCCVGLITLFQITMQDIAATLIKEAHQSSTNGSFVAGLAFDDNMDTFSLTNDGANQSWSATLVKPNEIAWIFVRIKTGICRLFVGLDDADLYTCVKITDSIVDKTDIIEKVFTCTETYTINKIKISTAEEYPLKIYEVKIMGTMQNDPKVYTNFSGFPEKSEALDNNLHTFYQLDTQMDMLWFLRLNSTYEMKWILASIRGGTYELHITTAATSIVNGTTMCKEFNLSEKKQHQTAIECNRAMLGDTIIIKKTDEGSLRLFEIYPIVCPTNHYGPVCARCREKCQICDSITGRCTQCPASFYGEEYQYSCPQHCLDLICDQATGKCNGCQNGFKGRRCELRITTAFMTTVPQTNTPFLYCHHSCVTCNRDLQVCMMCFQRLETDICRYSCREICSGESACLGYQENCSRQENDQTAAVIKDAHQSSTNGSLVAGLGCDGDLDTFSLTNDGWNQWWSATLINQYEIAWVFIRVQTGTFRLFVGLNDAKHKTCVEVTDPMVKNAGITEKILACSDVYTMNKISLNNTGEGPLKVYEMKIMGTVQNDIELYSNFTGFPEESEALDNNLHTYYQSDSNEEVAWFLRLNATYEMKWILVSIRGGNYELHITAETISTNEATLCKKFSFSGIIKKHQGAIECDKKISGDTIIVKKKDGGQIRLFEIYPIVCPRNHYGPSCARCREKCQTCDSITGRCTKCKSTFFGEECQYSCPQHCLDMTCDQKTGKCNSCKYGYEGHRCEVEITTTVFSTEKYSTAIHFIAKDKTTTKRTDSRTEDNAYYYWALLSCMLVLLTILVFVVIILFSKRILIRLYKQRGVFRDDQHEDIGVLSENQQEMDVSANGLELEEIPQNEIGDIEEEVITVEYVNLTSQRVPIGLFLEELPNRNDEGILEKEFDELPYGLLESYSNALKSSNRNKSRYKGIFPYDYNGVRLDTEYENNEGFVNASYIHGYNKEKTYIAAQGPFNPRTLEDFWGMIWQNNSSRIVMLTSLYEGDRMKCLKYWPDIDHTVNFGQYSITLTTEDMYDSYTLRTINLKYEDEVKTVTQFHFTAWPDNSVPEDVTSLINFRNSVKSNLDSSEGPIVVHCSAGIGRTGTFIALDYILEEGATEQTVDVKGYVISLRHQRGKSIQTREQYVFLHDAVAEGLTQNNVYQRGLDVL